MIGTDKLEAKSISPAWTNIAITGVFTLSSLALIPVLKQKIIKYFAH